jgi:hypothetical protein
MILRYPIAARGIFVLIILAFLHCSSLAQNINKFLLVDPSNNKSMTLGISSLSAKRSLLLPDADGTILTSGTLGSSLVLTSGVLGIVDNSSVQKYIIALDGADIATRHKINFITGSNVTLTVSDDNANDKADVTIASSGGGGSGDFTGPSSSINKAIVRFNGTGGKTGQNSAVIVNDYSSSTQNNVALKADDGTTSDIDLAIVPKGTGSLLVRVPDGAATGGNARGQYAADLQMTRSSASQVASGNNSVVSGGTDNAATSTASVVGGGSANTASSSNAGVLGGQNNTASGQYSSILGGNANTASGSRSSIIGGDSAKATHYGEIAHAAGAFTSAGDAQSITFVLRGITTNSTVTEIFLDGAGQRMTLLDNSTWAFHALVVARRTNAASEGASYSIRGGIRRDNGANTTVLIQNATLTDNFEDDGTWNAALSADNTNGSLKLLVTGATGKTIRWVATVRVTQVTN